MKLYRLLKQQFIILKCMVKIICVLLKIFNKHRRRVLLCHKNHIFVLLCWTFAFVPSDPVSPLFCVCGELTSHPLVYLQVSGKVSLMECAGRTLSGTPLASDGIFKAGASPLWSCTLSGAHHGPGFSVVALAPGIW